MRTNNHNLAGRGLHCSELSGELFPDGRLGEILEKIRENDWLFIQLGHNDEKPEGAYAVAKLVAQGIREVSLPLYRFLLDSPPKTGLP